jgi:hypothetical protein
MNYVLQPIEVLPQTRILIQIELSILQRQCLARRVPDEQTLKREIVSWENQRNEEKAKIDWRCSITDTR